jgi:NADPH-dependent curcumin reductase CurA
MAARNLQVCLARRPRGAVSDDDFRIVETDLRPLLHEGEVLVSAETLSLDPYMRSRMDEASNYACNVALGDVMVGEAVGRVVESRDFAFQVGDYVIGMLGWQRFGALRGSELRKLDARAVPPSAFLGVLGLPGVTAWCGLREHGRLQPGETVVVSAASGAVGSVVGQLAEARGLPRRRDRRRAGQVRLRRERARS